MSHGDVAEQIHLELLAPLRDRQRFDRGVDRNPGVVHQRTKGTMPRVAGHPFGDRGDVRF